MSKYSTPHHYQLCYDFADPSNEHVSFDVSTFVLYKHEGNRLISYSHYCPTNGGTYEYEKFFLHLVEALQRDTRITMELGPCSSRKPLVFPNR